MAEEKKERRRKKRKEKKKEKGGELKEKEWDKEEEIEKNREWERERERKIEWDRERYWEADRETGGAVNSSIDAYTFRLLSVFLLFQFCHHHIRIYYCVYKPRVISPNGNSFFYNEKMQLVTRQQHTLLFCPPVCVPSSNSSCPLF